VFISLLTKTWVSQYSVLVMMMTSAFPFVMCVLKLVHVCIFMCFFNIWSDTYWILNLLLYLVLYQPMFPLTLYFLLSFSNNLEISQSSKKNQ
jgi:hypothetical protein